MTAANVEGLAAMLRDAWSTDPKKKPKQDDLMQAVLKTKERPING